MLETVCHSSCALTIRYDLAVFSLTLAVIACGAKTPPAQAPELESVDVPSPGGVRDLYPRQLESFDYTWNAINDSYWDADFLAADWALAREQLRPKILAAQSANEAREVIRELLRRTKQSHFGLMAPRSNKADEDGDGGPAEPGFDIRIVGDDIFVSRVVANGPAAVAGIVPGWLLVQVGDTALKEVLSDYRKSRTAAGVGAHATTSARLMENRAIVTRTHGAVGDRVLFRFLDGHNSEKRIPIILAPPSGMLANFGNLTNIPVEYESRFLDPKKTIGYVRLSVFFDPVQVIGNFRSDVKRFANAKGLVLDFRGNPGGIGLMSTGFANLLIADEGKKLGTMISRDSKLKFVLNPQPGAFVGKVAVLVDELCASTCEIIAGGLADIKRARIFGQVTAGVALPSQIVSLPSGDLLQYATANYISESGATLEGKGVTPDEIIELDRKKLLRGTDSQISAAIHWINQL